KHCSAHATEIPPAPPALSLPAPPTAPELAIKASPSPGRAAPAPQPPHSHGAESRSRPCPAAAGSHGGWDGKIFQVLLGAHSLTKPEPHKRLYRVRAQIPHPGSNIHNNKDDLLLLQLEEKAELNEHVQVLPFQREDRDVAADTVCKVAGWGTTSHSGHRPDELHSLERPVISRDVCNHRTRHDHTITEKMMCTDSRKKDTCKGDSGGPLVCNGVAEGVVTAGSRVCGNYKKPAIYTRIAPYVAWIDSVMASAAGEGDTR
uniref:Complement factor D n=1 Tax=Falco tinnunculus TaxID=100819 RepID=A0A8C4U2I4_FALTI